MATFIPPGCLDCVVPQFLASFSWLCLESACVCQQMLLSGEALELFLSLGEISLRCSDYTGWQQPGDILEAAFTILFLEVLRQLLWRRGAGAGAPRLWALSVAACASKLFCRTCRLVLTPPIVSGNSRKPSCL